MLMRYTLPSRKLMLTAALVALGAGWLTRFSRMRSGRLEGRPRAKPEHLQIWEGEGGGIPTPAGRTVAQVDPVADMASRDPTPAGRTSTDAPAP